jgi:phosphate transport system protein
VDPYVRLHSKLDRDLVSLRDDVLRLSDMTDKAISGSVNSFNELDINLATDTIANDARLNSLRYQIEQQGYHMLAMQQPTARDMRAIIAAIHIAVELERIADYAAGISKLTLKLSNAHVFKPTSDFANMVQVIREMLTATLDAYINWDASLAYKTFKRDDEVDEMAEKTYTHLVAVMGKESKTIESCTYMLWIAHNLERMADRVTNICERVIYMVTGELVDEKDG